MDPKTSLHTTAGSRPRAGRWLRFLLACVAIIALYGVAGGLVLPPLAKKIAAEKLGEKLGRDVVIDGLSINPYTLSVTVAGLRVFERDRSSAFIAFDALNLDGSIVSIYRLAPVFDAVTLSGLRINLVRGDNNEYNFSDILERVLAAPRPTESQARDETKFSFSNIRVSGARVDFDDRPRRARHQITEIDISVPFISNLATHLKDFVQPAFSAKVNGAPFRLAGETTPFQNSLETHVTVNFDALDLRKYLEYSPVALPVKVDSALLDAQLRWVFTQSSGRQPSLRISGHAALRDLRVSTAVDNSLARLARLDVDVASIDPLARTFEFGAVRIQDAGVGKDLLRLPKLEASGITVDLAQRRLVFAKVAAEQGALALKRAQDGSFAIPSLDATARESGASASESAPDSRTGTAPANGAAPWSVTIEKLALLDSGVSVFDAAVKPAITHQIKIADLQAQNLSTDNGAKGTVTAQLGINRAGSLNFGSTITFKPLAVSAQIDARRLDLTALRPYLARFANVNLVKGSAAAKGTVALSERGEGLRITYAGGADVTDLASIDTKNNEELLNWGSLKLSDVALDVAPGTPLSLSIAALTLDNFYSRLVLNPDGRFNLQELRGTPDGDPAQDATAAPAPAQARQLRIDQFRFVRGRVNFTDHYIKPNYSADLTDVEGAVTGLSSDPASRGVVDFKGRYDRTAPVSITGTINPLRGDLFVDIKATGKDIELPALTAYSTKYAGYGITGGKLSLDVSYRIENGKLEAQNNVLLEQLTFGEHVDGPDATKLPVLFALSLLKNSRGEIAVNLPISGSLDDPQFSVGGLIVRLVVNLLTKALTSPFALLGAAFAGGGDDLAYVEFDYGSAILTAAAEAKLANLATALKDRPALKLEIAARVDPALDLDALRQAAFDRKLKAAKREELASDGKRALDVDAISVEPAEYAKYLKLAYGRESFSKPRNLIGIAKDLPVAEMEDLMRNNLNVGDEDVRALALSRAERVKSFLVEKGSLSSDRFSVANSAADAKTAGKAKASRVDFVLK